MSNKKTNGAPMETKFKKRLENIADKALDNIEKHPIRSIGVALLSAWVAKKIFNKED